MQPVTKGAAMLCLKPQSLFSSRSRGGGSCVIGVYKVQPDAVFALGESLVCLPQGQRQQSAAAQRLWVLVGAAVAYAAQGSCAGQQLECGAITRGVVGGRK